MSGLISEVKESKALPSPVVARAIREAAGVPRARLAAELHVNPLTVWRWETGATTPSGPLRLAYGRLLRRLDQVVRATQEAA